MANMLLTPKERVKLPTFLESTKVDSGEESGFVLAFVDSFGFFGELRWVELLDFCGFGLPSC